VKVIVDFSLVLMLVGGYYVDGLVHISEVSWDLVRDVRDVLKKGDDVRVKVVQIDV
jgi:predicted RNA-binding protein with RPS1 domain